MRPLYRGRTLLPLGLLGVAAALIAFVVRGTWAEPRRAPSALGEGPICYVRQDAPGEKEVCCALRLAAPLDEVWEAITDYEHFGDICECVHAERIEHEPDGRCRLSARANTVLAGQLPFAVEMHNEQSLEQYIASWDQPSGETQVNRGRWVLTPLGPRETLLEISMEIQID